MPRPSLKSIRRDEILEAFSECVSRFGLDGATQERIAEAAGVKRSILRHYLGNRDEMIAALVDHMAAQFDAQTVALNRALPKVGRIDVLLDLLFGFHQATPANTVLAFQAIVASADRIPRARTVMLSCIARFLSFVEDELSAAYPRATAPEISSAAFGLVSLYFNLDSLAPLQPPEAWRTSSQRVARAVIQSLGENGDD